MERRIPKGWQAAIDAGTPFGLRAAAVLEKPPGKVSRKTGRNRQGGRGGHRERVGAALAKRISGLVEIKHSKGCKCEALSEKMNSWGIAGCEKRREEIIDSLVANRDLLVESLKEAGSAFTALAVSLSPDVLLRIGAGKLLDAAIQDVRNQPQPPKRERKLNGKSAERFFKSLTDEQLKLYNANLMAPPPAPDPFTDTPIVHFGAHLWPVRGNWEWHVDRWNELVETVNGKCVVIVATDATTSTAAEVRSRLSDRIEIIELPNTKQGENPSFRILQTIIPNGQNDVLLYCHGKGVRAHTAKSEAVRVWTEIMYETILFNQPRVIERLNAGYKNVHSFRTYGGRPLSPAHRWHPSGTFFAVRAKYLPGRKVKDRYGGVEAWCGDHFPASESWCEFGDNSMFTVMYDGPQLFATHVNPQMDWEATRLGGPRCEQHKRELDWFLSQLREFDSVLVIGSKHGGLEFQIRRWSGWTRTTSIDIAPQPDNEFCPMVGDSRDLGIQAWLRSQGPFDVVFIDGDHSYNGAKSDFEFAQSLNPRFIAFHDIHDTLKHRNEGCEVNRLWNEIKASHSTSEKIIGAGWGGIGVVHHAP